MPLNEFDVAVLIPTYKPKDYFVRCLQSLDQQTLSKERFCVYIALNGSDEADAHYVQHVLTSPEYHFSFNYQFFVLEQAGVSHARNYLLDHTEEPYVVFVDDDDVLSANYLDNLLAVTSTKYMGISNTLSFDSSVETTRDNFIGITFNSLNAVERSKFKSRKYFSSPWAKMLHRSHINELRFDEKLKRNEDSFFMAELSKNIQGVKKTSSDTFYYVYERAGSASRSQVKFKEELAIQLYVYYKYFLLLFNPKYNQLFILTRIAATMKHIKRLF